MKTTAGATTPRPSPTVDPEVAGPLARQHAMLLRDVRHLADPVLALLAQTHSWPHAELGTLIRYLRTAVARQARDEEELLYGTAAPFAELATAHVQLHTLTEQLDQADAASCSAVGLRELVEQLLQVLEHHLVQEQAVLVGHQASDNPRSSGG